jgi:hypothetical protein
MKKGDNKYGIKLEDYSDYAAYKKAIMCAAVKAYHKTSKGKLTLTKAISKYTKTEKGRVNRIKAVLKYSKTEKGKGYVNALSAKRRAAKLQRTPAWADLKAIRQFYLNCPKGYHVDHIVPLQGDNVSGFHVLNNLQYLTKSENCSKGNKLINQ